jgi:hypothetical protein
MLLANLSSRSRNRKRRGNEIVEFALLAWFFAPLMLGTFVVGMNMVKSIQVNHFARDVDNMYLHGADFSTPGYQTLAKRLASGLNLQTPAFGSGVTNLNSNTGTSGDGIVWITQIMYVGGTTDPLCTSVGATNCANHDHFVYVQRITFGNSGLTSEKQSSLGDASAATISNTGTVRNFLTDVGAHLPTAAQNAMVNQWQTTANGRAPLTDGQIAYVVEAYFRSPNLTISSVSGKGVYARYFF